jgi:hypothetical protein
MQFYIEGIKKMQKLEISTAVEWLHFLQISAFFKNLNVQGEHKVFP